MRVQESFSDADIITAIRTGSAIDQAVGHIYRHDYRTLENYVLTNSGNRDDAADLIQEVLVTFIELVQNEKFRGESSIKSFLYSLTRNLWLTELRKRGNTARRNEQYELGRDTLEDDITGFLLYKEAQQTITDLFDQLGDPCRRILILFYYENRTMKEIMEQTRYENEQVVRNRKYKCLKELTDTIRQSPSLSETVKAALQRTR
ncbi:MAG: sigma-70 family RNA polymerase sigma factor [Bacteroidetes bacterium]|nr:sigma-70 family RNA polymerase sigma factor [Fibrella sp.]